MIVALDITPPVYRVPADTKVLDRDLFQRSVSVHAARIPAQKTGPIVKGLRKYAIHPLESLYG